MSKNRAFIATDLRELPVGDLLDKITAVNRAPAVIAAAKEAGNIVAADARPRITAPGYDGDKPGKVPLRDTIKTVVREYPGVTVMLVGAAWPDGAHGHLVEYGHIGKRKDGSTYHVPPNPWLRPAVEATQEAQKAAILEGLKAAAK